MDLSIFNLYYFALILDLCKTKTVVKLEKTKICLREEYFMFHKLKYQLNFTKHYSTIIANNKNVDCHTADK